MAFPSSAVEQHTEAHTHRKPRVTPHTDHSTGGTQRPTAQPPGGGDRERHRGKQGRGERGTEEGGTRDRRKEGETEGGE